MVKARYTHVSIIADDLEESVEFYESVFGLEKIPTPEFDQTVQWLQCGDLQLHIVVSDDAPPTFNHHALHVDDFESVLQNVMEYESVTVEPLPQDGTQFFDDEPPVYELPTGEIQFYIRDPAGNMIEVNHPDVDDLDRSIVKNIVKRTDVTPPSPGEEPAPIYIDD